MPSAGLWGCKRGVEVAPRAADSIVDQVVTKFSIHAHRIGTGSGLISHNATADDVHLRTATNWEDVGDEIPNQRQSQIKERETYKTMVAVCPLLPRIDDGGVVIVNVGLLVFRTNMASFLKMVSLE